MRTVPIASTPEQHALQDALRDWAKRTGTIAAVRARETATEPVDLDAVGVFSILSPDDIAASVADLAAAVEQLTVSLVPGAVMPSLLATAIARRAVKPAAVALEPGTLTATRHADGSLRVSGQTGPVLGAGAGAGLIAGTSEQQWFLIPPNSPRVTVTPLAALDFSRELGMVRLDDVTVTPLPEVSTRRVLDLAATLSAAEAAGVAAWCVATAVEYAKTRRQFGRAIGEFQAVKHICATMHCRAERAAAVAWDAARAADEAPADEASAGRHALAAATAAALALDDAVANAEDCIQVLGGIGFTWEHDAHLYLRRAVALRQIIGGVAPWRDRVAKLTAKANANGGPDEDAEAGPDIGVGAWAASAIGAHGTAEQQDRFIPGTLSGDIVWCQLFSEPEAGSDLAGLKTRAIRDDHGWRLTGQKVWTSLARDADWAICLARTDPDLPKHKGLTFFLVDMHADGIEVRPLREITGRAVFNEVFLDDVFVADDCVTGAPGDGWRVAMTTLATERERLGGDDPVVALLELRGAHPAVRKLVGTERHQARATAALAALGPAGAAAGTAEAHEYLLTRCLSIAGGTTQILLNQIAERVLGLPR